MYTHVNTLGGGEVFQSSNIFYCACKNNSVRVLGVCIIMCTYVETDLRTQSPYLKAEGLRIYIYQKALDTMFLK